MLSMNSIYQPGDYLTPEEAKESGYALNNQGEIIECYHCGKCASIWADALEYDTFSKEYKASVLHPVICNECKNKEGYEYNNTGLFLSLVDRSRENLHLEELEEEIRDE